MAPGPCLLAAAASVVRALAGGMGGGLGERQPPLPPVHCHYFLILYTILSQASFPQKGGRLPVGSGDRCVTLACLLGHPDLPGPHAGDS